MNRGPVPVRPKDSGLDPELPPEPPVFPPVAPGPTPGVYKPDDRHTGQPPTGKAVRVGKDKPYPEFLRGDWLAKGGSKAAEATKAVSKAAAKKSGQLVLAAGLAAGGYAAGLAKSALLETVVLGTATAVAGGYAGYAVGKKVGESLPVTTQHGGDPSWGQTLPASALGQPPTKEEEPLIRERTAEELRTEARRRMSRNRPQPAVPLWGYTE